jgi:hypothetical protein
LCRQNALKEHAIDTRVGDEGEEKRVVKRGGKKERRTHKTVIFFLSHFFILNIT